MTDGPNNAARCRWRGRPLRVLAGLCLLAGCARQAQVTDPDAVLRSGWDHYRLGEFDGAIKDFEGVLAAVPAQEPRRPMALYGLACTWNLRRPGQDPTRAAQHYQQIVDEAPTSDLAAWSLLALARMKHLVPVGDEPNYDEVRQAYQAVIDRFPTHPAAEEAFIYQQATYVAAITPETARHAMTNLETFVRTHLSSGFLSAAYSVMAIASQTLNDPEQRLQCELKAYETAEVDPSNPFIDNAWRYWTIATVAEFEVGDFDTAREFYGRLIKEYPTDIRKYASQQALLRMEATEARLRQAPPAAEKREPGPS